MTKKNSETDQKFPETEQIFFWSTKKSEKQTGQLVDQETDQNHMDGTYKEILVYQKEIWLTKKNQSLTENSLTLNNFFLVNQKK